MYPGCVVLQALLAALLAAPALHTGEPTPLPILIPTAWPKVDACILPDGLAWQRQHHSKELLDAQLQPAG